MTQPRHHPNQPTDADQQVLVEALTRRLHAEVDGYDAATRSRLNRARQAALAAAPSPGWAARAWALPVAAVACAAALALLVSTHWAGLPEAAMTALPAAMPADELAWITSAEAAGLNRQDPAFLAFVGSLADDDFDGAMP